jgi:hypothetical protein
VKIIFFLYKKTKKIFRDPSHQLSVALLKNEKSEGRKKNISSTIGYKISLNYLKFTKF